LSTDSHNDEWAYLRLPVTSPPNPGCVCARTSRSGSTESLRGGSFSLDKGKFVRELQLVLSDTRKILSQCA
jgi:hypothetical protein